MTVQIETEPGRVGFEFKEQTSHGTRFRNRGETVVGNSYGGVLSRGFVVDTGGLAPERIVIDALNITQVGLGGKRDWWIDVETGDVYVIHPQDEHHRRTWVKPMGQVTKFNHEGF